MDALVRPVAVAMVLTFALACGGGGGSTTSGTPNTPSTGTGFTLKTGVKGSSASGIVVAGGAKAALATQVPASSLRFNFGLAANQGGTLIVGHSGNSATQEYLVSANINGAEVGSNGVSETFATSDLSMIDNAGMTGPGTINLGSATPGVFLARFGASSSTTMTMTTNQTVNLASVDEICLRLANSEYPLTDGASGSARIVTVAHLYYNNALYAPNIQDPYNQSGPALWNENLTCNGVANSLQDMQYIFFVPSSRIGPGKSYFVAGGTPILGTLTYSNLGVADPAAYPVDADWMTASPGLQAAITYFAGASSGSAYDVLVTYFRSYFIKMTAAGSVHFGSLHTLGNTNNPSPFEIIALDEMPLNGTSVLNLQFDPTGSQFNDAGTNPDSMDIAGIPPLKFVTTITQ